MVHALLVKLMGEFYQIAQRVVGKILARQNSRILVQQLLESNKVTHLNRYGINTTVALVGHKVQLVLILYLIHIGSLGTHTITKGDMIGHLVVELHEVRVLSIDQPLVEVTVGKTDFRGFSNVTRF